MKRKNSSRFLGRIFTFHTSLKIVSISIIYNCKIWSWLGNLRIISAPGLPSTNKSVIFSLHMLVYVCTRQIKVCVVVVVVVVVVYNT